MARQAEEVGELPEEEAGEPLASINSSNKVNLSRLIASLLSWLIEKRSSFGKNGSFQVLLMGQAQGE